MSDNKPLLQSFLEQFDALLKKESSEKVSRAMTLFMQVDDTYKRIVFFSAGFSGPVSAKMLRDHFEFLDLTDAIDGLIYDLEFELQE